MKSEVYLFDKGLRVSLINFCEDYCKMVLIPLSKNFDDEQMSDFIDFISETVSSNFELEMKSQLRKMLESININNK